MLKSNISAWTFQTAYRDAFHKGENAIDVGNTIKRLKPAEISEAAKMLRELGYTFPELPAERLIP